MGEKIFKAGGKLKPALTAIFAALSVVTSAQTPDTVSVEALNLDEVVVTGSRVPVSRHVVPAPVSVVDRSTIERGAETNLLPILAQRVPGLFVTSRTIAGYGVSNGAAGGINMRGMAGGAGRVLILVDGHPQYATIYGHPVADAYVASEAERVEVSRGASSVLYGSNAMGGAINIITRKALEEGNRLNAKAAAGSYGTQRYSLTDRYRRGRLSGVVSGNHEKTDGHRTNSAFESLSGYARLGYEMSKRWRVTGNVNVSKSESQNPGEVTRPMLDGTAHVLRGMAGLAIENNYERTRGAVNVYHNWGRHKINDGYHEGGAPRPHLFRSTDQMGGANIYQTVALLEGNSLTGGFDAKLYGGSAHRDPVTEVYADDVRLHEIAGYIAASQTLGPVTLGAGVRLENHKLYGTEWVPQAGVSFRAARRTNVKFSFSKGFRTPNIRELYINFFPGGPSNPDLRPERNRSYDLTVSQGLAGGRLSVEATLFHMDGDNMIAVIPVDGTNKNMNTGRFSNNGVEVDVRYSARDDLNLNANYSHLHMNTPITGSPANKLYAEAIYTPGRLELSAGVQVVGKLYLSTGSDAVTSNYTLVDAKVSYRATRWLEMFVKGDNLLARRYETMKGFPMPGATFMAGVSVDL